MPLTHLVFFQFTAEATQDKVDEFFTEIVKLKDLIPGISAVKILPPNNSYESFTNGWAGNQFARGFEMIMDDDKARDSYLPHDEHMRVVNKFKHLFANVCIYDYNN